MHRWVSTVNVFAFVFSCYMYAFVGAFSMLYAVTVLQVALLSSATAGVASLTLLASRCMITQCLFIVEVIKLSG